MGRTARSRLKIQMSEGSPTGSAANDVAQARAELVAALMATGAEDRSAFRRVYKLTSAKLFGICLRICGDRQGAEDVLQDVYLTIWKRAGGFEPSRGSPITWLAAIAHNRAIDWCRATGVRSAAPIADAVDVADDTPSAIETMLMGEADHALHRCLDQLEVKQRTAIRTAFFDGLTYAQLGDRLAVPLSTIKSWVRRGLMRLKDCLDDA